MDIKLNLSYYAIIMLHAFKDLLCLKLCWNNRPGPIAESLVVSSSTSGQHTILASHFSVKIVCRFNLRRKIFKEGLS